MLFLLIVSQFLFCLLIFSQWENLLYAPHAFWNFVTGAETYSGNDLLIGQGGFYLLGFVLVLLSCMDLVGRKYKKRFAWRIYAYGIYFMVFMVLELPLFDTHPGFGGPELHSHSFWAGFHFH